MSRSNQINSVIWLMALGIFLTIVEAADEILIVKVKNDDEIIELNFQRKDEILANEHLPIYLAYKHKAPKLIPDVMTTVGEFVMYQDIEKTSAVVHIKAHDKIYGVIDTRFVILDLPLEKLGSDIYFKVGGEYIKAREEDAKVRHLQNNYDAVLSALLTHEEINYVNSIIDQTNTAHETRSPQFTHNEFYRMPSTSGMNTIDVGHQYLPQNSYGNDPWQLHPGQFQSNSGIDSDMPSTDAESEIVPNVYRTSAVGPTYEVPSTFFYPGMSTDITMKHRMPPQNINLDVTNTLPEIKQVDASQYVLQEFAGDYEQSPSILYPEILVFITHDVFSKNVNVKSLDEIAALIQQYLIYFNAIDMLFAKLARNGILIHLNIAGVVIEADPGTFPYTYVQGTSDQIDVVETMSDFPRYIRHHKKIFSEDSFDFFYLSTSRVLYREDKRVVGVARVPFSIYENRKKNKPFAHVLGVIIQHGKALGTYIGSTHEIAHLMNIQHDPPHELFECDGTDTTIPMCNAIMQERDGFCQHCAIWSEKSIKEFRLFIRSNRNHCFFLNYPRSLYPYDHPMPNLSLYDQCVCYGFIQSDSDLLRLANSCDAHLNCDHNGITKAIFPLDGTPCDVSKVCWRRQCLSVGEPAHHDYKEQVKENEPPKPSTRVENTCQRLRGT